MNTQTDTQSTTVSIDKQVLLIEDDQIFAGVLARALERRGYLPALAHTVADALDAARRLRPRYAVLDMNLSGENGMQLIAPLLQAAPDCRIVVLTGYASIATAVKAIKLGAAEYLAKPVDSGAVLRALSDVDDDSVDTEAPDVPLSVDQVEWEHIQRVLGEHNGNITATARALNMHRRTLQRKLAKHAPRRRPIEGS
jgi:two-component system, response regulator RegA